MVEPFEIRLRGEDLGAFGEVEIEIAARARNRLVPPAVEKARHAKPFDEMLALKPGLELGLAAGAAVVEDREHAQVRTVCHRHSPQ